MALVNIFNSVLHLFYPQLCAACKRSLFRNETELCASCLHTLPYTHFKPNSSGPLQKIFWGRVHVEFVYALLYFDKRSRVQNILHGLKYKGRAQLGVVLGNRMAKDLEHYFKEWPVDEIVPVPLHKRRVAERGYNQAEKIGLGIAQGSSIKLCANRILRNRYTQTQTRFSREKRMENLKSVFEINRPDELKGKHILLVDDVLTTGSTIESCAIALQQIEGIKISVAVVAFA